MIVIINHNVPANAPLIPACDGVEDEKLVKNSGVKCPTPLQVFESVMRQERLKQIQYMQRIAIY